MWNSEARGYYSSPSESNGNDSNYACRIFIWIFVKKQEMCFKALGK